MSGEFYKGDVMANLGLSFSKESLERSMVSLSEEKALQMIGLAGNKGELEYLIRKLARSFNANIPASAFATIAKASKRFHQAAGSRMVSYAAA